MTDVIKFTKTAFTWSVVAVTILWSVGVSALAPIAAHGAECPTLEAGDLVKFGTSPAVYVIDENMTIRWFDNGAVFQSWGYSSADVNTVDPSCGNDYDLATMQPGRGYSYGLVKSPLKSDVYFLSIDGMLYNVPSEEVAVALFGASWAGLVRDVVPEFAANYGAFNSIEGDLSADMLPEGAIVFYGDAYWVHRDGAVYPVEGDLSQYMMDRAVQGTDDLLAGVEVMDDSTPSSSVLDVLRGLDMDDSSDSSDDSSDDVVTEGDLELSLAASTPDATVIPYDVKGVTYLTLLARAGDEDVEITGLTVERAGLGESNDFDKIYAAVDGVRVGNKRTLGSDDEVELFFTTDKNKIVVPANSFVEIDVMADMGAASSDSGNVSFLRVTDVETDAAVDADFPIVGNEMALSGIAGPALDFEYSGDTDEVNVGDMQIEVAEFVLDGDDSEDVMLYSVTLKQEGSAGTDEVVNYTLYDDNDNVIAGPVDARSDDYVVFELDTPFLLEEDENNYDFTVKADIASGNGETVELELDEATDVYAIGQENGYVAAPADNDSGNANDVHSINGGALTITESDDNPDAESYAVQATDVLLLEAELEAEDETIVVTSFPLVITKGAGNIDTSDNNVEIEDLHVTVDGKTVCGKLDLDDSYTAANAITVTCSDEFEVTGTQMLRVYADFTDQSESTYTASITSAGNAVQIEDLSGDELYSTGTTFDVSGSVTGGTATIDNGTLSVSKKTSYTNRTITTGATAYKIGSYVLKAPASQGINIDRFTVTLNGSYDEADLADLYISADTDVVSDPSASENFNVSLDLDAEETLNVEVFATLDDNTTGTITTTLAVRYEGLDDETTTSTAAVTGQTITVAAGTLADDRDASTPDADIVIGGSTNVHVYSIEFDPSYDTYTVTDLDISMSNDSAVTALHIGDATVENFTSGRAEFSGLSIDVPAGGVVVDVYADFNLVDTDTGVDSGVTTTFDVYAYEASADEGDDINESSPTVAASEVFELRNSRPTLAYSAGTEAASNGLLSAGDNEIVEMTVLASNGIVDFKGITLDIDTDDASTTANISYITLLDDNRDFLATTTVADATDASGWDLSGLSASDREVGAGDTNTYYISVNLSGIDDSDQVAIKVTDITWDDDVETGDIDGTYVEQLPSAKFLATENS